MIDCSAADLGVGKIVNAMTDVASTDSSGNGVTDVVVPMYVLGMSNSIPV